MKVVILAGGLGTRLSEETVIKPKPMVEIGGIPILIHIMKIYSYYGFNEFVILLGYKGDLIKEYFNNYFLYKNNVTFNLRNNELIYHENNNEPWKVTLVDTGKETMTGGRIKQAKPYIDNATFMLTYGDGVSDLNIKNLLNFHKKHKKILTMTSVQPDGRFGTFESNKNGKVTNFLEKPKGEGSWVNGGFFVCEPEIFKYIENNSTSIFERRPMENLAKKNQLYSFRHNGFWKCMDTLRDKNELDKMWNSKKAKWRRI